MSMKISVCKDDHWKNTLYHHVNKHWDVMNISTK